MGLIGAGAKGGVAIVLALLLAGCATVPLAEDGRLAEARRFQSRPGSATLYVYRNQRLGLTEELEVRINGVLAGSTAPRTFLWLELPPGQYRLSSGEAVLDADLRAGRIYFVRQVVALGLPQSKVDLTLVDHLTGRRGVSQCQLALASPYVSRLGGRAL